MQDKTPLCCHPERSKGSRSKCSTARSFVVTLLRITAVLILLPFTFVFADSQIRAAIPYFQKALDKYNHQDFIHADTYLKLALEYDPHFGEAFLLRSLLEYHNGDIEKAKTSMIHAQAEPWRMPQAVRDSLERQTQAIDAIVAQQEVPHFHLQFYGAHPADLPPQTIKELDAAYGELGSEFSVTPASAVPVVIFGTGQMWEAWHAPLWLGQAFDSRDGQIRIRTDMPEGGEEEFRRRLRHELLHAFLHQIYPKELPLWFEEGVAQWFAYNNPDQRTWNEDRFADLVKVMKGAPGMDLKTVNQTLAKKDNDCAVMDLAYLESETMVLSIAHQKGNNWIPSLLQRIRQGQSFELAFQDLVGYPPARQLQMVQSLTRS